MGNMFNNYPQPANYIPNNRIKTIEKFELDIMTGESASHTFEVPLDVEGECSNVEVIYKVGINVVLVKDMSELDIEPEPVASGETPTYTFIIAHISPEETLLFNDTLLDTFVQLKFVLNDGDVLYTEIYPVNVVDSLDTGTQQ